MTDASLAALIEACAAATPGCLPAGDGPVRSWAIRGQVFAVLASGTVEYRLDPVVGAAARRTPDTAASSRGPDWVAFRPNVLDQYAEDRLTAWFRAAARRAAG